MAVKDLTKHYTGIAPLVPNTVSRHEKVGDRSFAQVVSEAGKPVLDAELNLNQDAQQWANYLFRRWQAPSGWLRGQSRQDARDNIITETAPLGLTDDSALTVVPPPAPLIDGTTLVNSIVLPRIEALVAGHPVVVEYTNTQTEGYNLVELLAPTLYTGPLVTKRTDFVFLEVWQALVAPSAQASGYVQVADFSSLIAGDTVSIGNPGPLPLTAVVGPATPGADDFQIGISNDATASNIAASINDPANSFAAFVYASALANLVRIWAVVPGAPGNLITLAVAPAVPGTWAVSGPNLTGGADRPNKPSESQLYRHGNTQSPSPTWLDDEINDPTLKIETSQRVQIQYRLRVTSDLDGIDFKVQPDGFSVGLNAQGGTAAPVALYPFVPADKTSVFPPNTSAVAYGIEDTGLWIAGDGSAASALALQALDGFVYAIPICFIFRHNDCSNPLALSLGFNPVLNTDGAPAHNHLGYIGFLGLVPPGISDRPDGKFCDVISLDRILDLRKHIVPSGLNLDSELEYQIQSLLDGKLATWAIDRASKKILGTGSGDVSVQPLVCNEIGRDIAHGGVAPISGEATGRGDFIRNFDHVARRFGSQPITERVLFAFYPGDRQNPITQAPAVPPGVVFPGKWVFKRENPPGAPSSTSTWYEGDTLHLDLAQFDTSTLSSVFQGGDGNLNSAGAPILYHGTAPPGSVITDILRVYHDDGDYNAAVDQSVQVTLITGLGTPHVEITLDANDTTATGGLPVAPYRMVDSDVGVLVGSPRRIFVEVEITYPVGAGLTDTPDLTLTPDASFYTGFGESGPGPQINTTPAQRPSDTELLSPPSFREGYREVRLEYVTNNTTVHGPSASGIPVPDEIVSANNAELAFPRRVYGSAVAPFAGTPTVDDISAGPPVAKLVDLTNTEFGSSSRKVMLAGPLLPSPHTLCQITYFPVDPIPNYGMAGYQTGVYYRANAPQTAGVKEGSITAPLPGNGTLPAILRVQPLAISRNLWTGQVGMGSVDQAYPYASPLDQIPINDGGASSTFDWYFMATADIAVDDFDATTGLLALHPFVQADGQNVLSLGGLAPGTDPQKDAEFRAYYPFADDTTYRPTVMSQPLFGAVRHKVFVPLLARAAEETKGAAGGLLFRKNELLLVVLTRFAELDGDNSVRFVDPLVDNRTCAGVYRTRNMLLTVGD